MIFWNKMSLPLTPLTETWGFGVITQIVGVDFPGLNNIHDNYQKDVSSFVEIGLSKALHHALKVVHAVLDNLLC